MNKYLLFVTALFFACFSALSQTNVSGNIAANTTWTKAGSPYLLTGNVGVRTGLTLTIEPGVTVMRMGDYQVLVNGAVKADGTETDSIEFITNINPVPPPKIFPFAPDTRPFIEFQKSSLGNSSVSYAAFWQSNYVTNHIRLGNESSGSQTTPKNSGTLSIRHCTLSNGFVTADEYGAGAELFIDSSYMDNGSVYAYSASGDILTVTNSRIVNSLAWSSVGNHIAFTNCYLGNNGLYFPSDAEVLNCTLERCKSEPLGSSNSGRTVISNSNLINTYFRSPYTTFSISDCRFTVTDTLIDSYGYGVQYLLTMRQGSVNNVQFTDSSSFTISGINVFGDFNSPGLDTLAHNRFENLYDAVTVQSFTAIQFDSNSFFMPRRYDINNQSTKDFSAPYNYYELTGGRTIDDLIFDQNDDLTYGLVTYTPYIPDPVVLPVTLTRFAGNAEGKTVQLFWETGTQANTAKYIVERRAGNSFITVGTLPATGSHSYRFTDNAPAAGTNQYRLKMVDKDGNYTYSDLISVSFTVGVSRLYIYPNPAATYVVAEHKASARFAQVELADVSGRIIKTLNVPAGSTQTILPVAGLEKGIYRVIWRGDDSTESRSVLIK